MVVKKVGILTFWGVANYGAWSQAYALNNVLQERYGNEYQIEHIAYLEESHWNMYYKCDKKLENSFSYNWRLIPHTKKMSEKELQNEQFNILIIGSDAVWEFSNSSFQDDYHMLGDKLNADKICSYAASFGNFCIADAKKDLISGSIQRFSSISVRDSYTLKILKGLEKADIFSEVVVDPVLLWDFKKDKRVITPIYDKYILVYGSEWNQNFVDNAVRFAKEKNLILISVGFVNSWCDVNLRMIELRALEWIGFFRSAEYVFTSTFHGLMFGLVYEKQVKFDCLKYVENRSETLIEQLHIPNCSKIFAGELDYSFINRKLEEMRETSLQYLSGIFSQCNNE